MFFYTVIFSVHCIKGWFIESQKLSWKTGEISFATMTNILPDFLAHALVPICFVFEIRITYWLPLCYSIRLFLGVSRIKIIWWAMICIVMWWSNEHADSINCVKWCVLDIWHVIVYHSWVVECQFGLSITWGQTWNQDSLSSCDRLWLVLAT